MAIHISEKHTVRLGRKISNLSCHRDTAGLHNITDLGTELLAAPLAYCANPSGTSGIKYIWKLPG